MNTRVDFFISSSLPEGFSRPENSRSKWTKKEGGRQHPALIVLAAFVAIGLITAILTALASALPRTTTAIGVLYCTAMYGLAALAVTNDPIWTTVMALLTALIS